MIHSKLYHRNNDLSPKLNKNSDNKQNPTTYTPQASEGIGERIENLPLLGDWVVDDASDLLNEYYRTALREWINSDDLNKCPHCGKKYSIPGLDSSKCREHGYILHRHEKIRQYCLYDHKEENKKKSVRLDPKNLTEDQAKAVLLNVAPEAIKGVAL